MKRVILPILLILIVSCAPATQHIASATAALHHEDAELDAVIAQAHATLPEFIALLAESNPAYSLIGMKVRFSPREGGTRDVWTDGVTYINDQFMGNMGDEIPSLHLAFDDRIVIDEQDIVDWMIVMDGKLIGGYTIRLYFLRMTPAEQKMFLENVDYSLE